MRSFFRRSISIRIFALVAGILFSVSAALSGFFIHAYTNRVIEQFKSRGTWIAEDFARSVSDDVVVEDIDSMSQRLAALLKTPDVVLGDISSKTGVVLAHRYGFSHEGTLELELPPGSPEPVVTALGPGIPALLFRVPVRNTMGEQVGLIRVGLSLESLRHEKSQILLSFCLMVALFLSVGLAGSYAFARGLSRPVLELADTARKVAAGDYRQDIRVHREDEIGLLADCFREMCGGILKRDRELADINARLEQLVDQRTVELRQAVRKMDEILNNVEEGVIIVGPTLRCGTDVSPALGRIYGADLKAAAEQSLISFIFPRSSLSPDAVSACESALVSTIGSDEISWDLNSSHLVTGTVINNYAGERKELALSWRPIVADGQIERVVLGIRDVTVERTLQQEIQETKRSSQALLRKIEELITSRGPDLDQFITEAEKRLKTAREGLEGAARLEQALSELHTVKGGSRTFGLKGLSSLVHETEDLFRKLREGKPGVDLAAARCALEQVRRELGEYRRILTDYLSMKSSAPTAGSLSAIVGMVLPGLQATLRAAGIAWGGIEIDDGLGELDEELRTAVFEVALHALTNSVDHGYVIPRRQGRTLPAPDVRIRVLGTRFPSGELQLRFEDNGAGIDFQAVERLAARRGHPRGSSEEEFLSVLFLPGVSTTEQVTETSGRGVGMVAIQAAARRLGGKARLLRGQHGGTVLELLAPTRQSVAPRAA